MSTEKLATPKTQLSEFNKNLNATSKSLLKIEIPQKIVDINKLIRSENFCPENLVTGLKDKNKEEIKLLKKAVLKARQNKVQKDLSSSDDSSSIENPETMIPLELTEIIYPNETLIGIMNLVKPLIIENLQDVRNLLLWIQLKVPEIADGNNFGVSVQEEVISTLGSIESQIISDLDMFTDYFNQRGKILIKLLKFSNVSDFSQAVCEHDESFYYKLRETAKNIQNHYLSMQNICVKNIVKITVPRNEKNSLISSMY